MRLIICMVLFGFYSLVNAQNRLPKKHDVYYVSSKPVYVSTNFKELDTKSLVNLLQLNYFQTSISGQSLELDYEKFSPLGKHLRFKHMYLGLPVFESFVQVNINAAGNVYLIIDNLAKFDQIDNPTGNKDGSAFWMNTSNGLTPAYVFERWDSSQHKSAQYYYNLESKLLLANDPRLYFTGPDSMVSAMVYLPNPIVAKNATYGGGYVDNGDKDSPELTNARSKVRLPLFFENGKFHLSDGLIILKNINDPKVDVIEPTDTFIDYTRSQPGFEDINAFYHLNSFSTYLRKIGFSSLLDTIYVDTHGANGEDNSFLDQGKKPLELEYGIGGIDDAEDGQVVIHEFGHSLSVLASPKTVRGNERIAMEEGQADYICMSYSKSLSKNKPYDVFSWDGHNEIWDGFTAKTSMLYPDRTGFKDIDRQIWSTALLCMHDKLRRTKSDSLVLSSYFLQAADASMPQMARVILKLDSILFGAKELDKIWQCFTDQGILDTVPASISVHTIENVSKEIKFVNTSGFSLGDGDAHILFKFPHHWERIEIYSSTGQRLYNLNVSKEVVLESNVFGTGVYLVKMIGKGSCGQFIQKLIKY